MSDSLAKRLKEHSVVLSDLDGLLVNAEDFHQAFVQRSHPGWISATVNRVIKSDKHLKRLTQILVNFIVSGDRHPEFVSRALAWFTNLLNSPARERLRTDPELREIWRPLVSYTNEMAGLRDLFTKFYLRCTAAQQWSRGKEVHSGVPHNLYYGGLFDVPSTGYVYVDDSDEEFGQRSLRIKQERAKTLSENEAHNSHADAAEGIDSDLEDIEQLLEDNADLDTDDVYSHSDDMVEGDGVESDLGVFDVNETTSSDDPHVPELGSPLPRSDRSNQIPSSSFDMDPNEVDEEDIGIDEDEDTDFSDEALDLLMWTRDQTNSSSSTDSDQEPVAPVQSPRKQLRKRSPSTRCAKLTSVQSEPRRVTRQSTSQLVQSSEPRQKKRKRESL